MATGPIHGEIEEDRILAETEWPTAASVGASVVVLAVTVASTAGFLTASDGDDRVGVSLVLAASLPWLLDLLGVSLRFELFCALAIVPLGALTVVCLLGVVDADGLGAQLSLFPLLVLAVVAVVGARRRVAVLVAVVVYAIVLGRTVSGGWIDLGAWHIAVILVVAGALAVRMLVVSMAEVREAREALERQTMADERRRIVRDVHDVVAHTLTVTLVHITAARMAVRRSSPQEAAEALEEAERHGRASLADVRRIVRLLRADQPTALETPQPGLADLADLVDGYRVAGQPVELAVTGRTDAVSPAVGLAVYRVLQEALANASRHGSGPAAVDLAIGEDDVTLRVENPLPRQGQGSERRAGSASTAAPDARGSGLDGMRERMSAAGGTLEVGPVDGRWTVVVRVPLDT